jgi:hypothetical protein
MSFSAFARFRDSPVKKQPIRAEGCTCRTPNREVTSALQLQPVINPNAEKESLMKTTLGSLLRGTLALTAGVLLATAAQAAAPYCYLTSPGAQTIEVGTSLTISGYAYDNCGDIQEHWLEIKRPAGDWNWEGWLISEPFAGDVSGDSYYSYKSGSFTFNDVGTYVVRTTARNSAIEWGISQEITITVVPRVPHVSITVGDGSSYIEVSAYTELLISGTATDSDGDMTEHWLEIQNPSGQWSWEGWLTDEPFGGAINGSQYSSSKSGYFTFTDYGTYTVRCTALDPHGWQISSVVYVYVY